MIAYRELEARLRECVDLYDREVPPIRDFERRIMARVAITPREEGPRRSLRHDVLLSALVAAAILGLAIAITAGVRLGLMRQPNVPVKHSQQFSAVPCISNFTQLGFGNGPIWPAKMVSPTIGWAKGGLRTTDGGVHWRDVSGPALREGSASRLYPPGYADFYLDGQHAWQAAVYGSTTSCNDHLSTFATSDGGNTWKQSGPVPLNLPSGHQTGTVQIGFMSPLAGWLWVPTGSASATGDPFFPSVTGANLYATSDGGMTWRQLSSLSSSYFKGFAAPPGSNCKPGPGAIAFSSPSVGWVSVNCTDTILITRDAGASWKVQTFPTSGLACPCHVQLPNFLDVSHGIAVASGSDNKATDLLLMTTDGGTTWRQSAHPGTGYLVQIDPVDANRLFALVTPPGWTKVNNTGFELYRSVDGGGSWTLVNGDVPASWPPGYLQFVDSNHGFESNINGAADLLTTDNGGRSWKSITPAIK